MDQSYALLQRIPYFQRLSEGDLRRLHEHSTLRRLGAGEALFLEGGECQGLYVVESGLVRIYKTSPEGREQVLLIASAGDSFNEVPIFDAGPNPASATTLAPSCIRILPKAFLLEMMRSSPEVAFSVLAVLSRRLRHLTMLVEDLSFKHVNNRVAKILLQASESAGGAGLAGPLGSLTQQEMANIIGTTRQVVARSLKELEEKGIIQRRRTHIDILKPALLRSFL